MLFCFLLVIDRFRRITSFLNLTIHTRCLEMGYFFLCEKLTDFSRSDVKNLINTIFSPVILKLDHILESPGEL